MTGGARGIGAAIAQAMTDAGAKVVIADLLDEEERARHKDRPGRQVRTPRRHEAGRLESAVESAVRLFGKLNVMVNNAGISSYGLIENLSHSDWDKVIASISPASSTASRQRLRPSGARAAGRSSNLLGSGDAWLRPPGYSCLQVGVRGLTKAAALEPAGPYPGQLRPSGIHRDVAFMSGPAPVTSAIPLRRIGEPIEVGNLAVFSRATSPRSRPDRSSSLTAGQTAGAIVWGFEDERAAQ